jgi:photosystem II stability/assembly factor-like uncharacterized protein
VKPLWVRLAVVITAAVLLSSCPDVFGKYDNPVDPGAPNYHDPKLITAFSFSSPTATGVINAAAKTILVYVPSSTNFTSLVATFSTTGISVTIGSTVQVSGVTANSFTSPVTYTVKAFDDTTVNYVVSVVLNPAKALTGFSFLSPAAIGRINEAAKTITVTVPYGTDVTALVATFTTTGEIVEVGSTSQVSGVTANDYTSPVTYTVTAADSSTANYSVTVQDFTEQTSAGSRNWLCIASSSDGTRLAAGVGDGYLYTSTNGGATWTERTSAGSRHWQSIASSSDGTRLAAVPGGGGYVYTSTDSGATWTERTSAGNRNWRSIVSSSDGTRLAAADGNNGAGYFYTSTDSGATWTERTNAGGRNWLCIASSSDGTRLAAVVWGGGYVYTSTNGGATWTERINAGSRNWHSIASSSDGSRLAACVGDGCLYTSTNGGAAWTEHTNAGDLYWYSIASSSDGTRLAACVFGGYIYTSMDSGATWTGRTSAGNRNWWSIVSSSDGTRLAAVVWGGYIYSLSGN